MDTVRKALAEDRARSDLTTRSLHLRGRSIKARIVAKQNCVIAGLGAARAVFRSVGAGVRFVPSVRDGAGVKRGRVVVRITGPAGPILAGERTALNFLQHLSGIATLTRRFVERVRPYRVTILDTRKTTPGLRRLEKEAVRMGGGQNHRASLAETILIKDNHIAVAGGIQKIAPPHPALSTMGEVALAKVQIEIRTFRELRQAVQMGFCSLLLDNMSPRKLRQAVQLARKLAGRRVLLEASGGVTLKNVRAIATTGVDRISIGALTHSAPAVDLSLEVMA